ncbi:hypothetical protein [Streptacidiphilus monticola]|uniref:Uncharacterized protein n=1 Tax=Streptacidiphilus monticola TaxID=2161674 RepID=A0ABW1G520_9ACTN
MKSTIINLTAPTAMSAALAAPAFRGTGLSFAAPAGARVLTTDVLNNGVLGNGSGLGRGLWTADVRDERPTSASVAAVAAVAGGYAAAAGAGAHQTQQSHLSLLAEQTQQQKIAATATTKMRAFRGPDPWIDRT